MTEQREQKPNGGEQNALARQQEARQVAMATGVGTDGIIRPQSLGEMIELCKIVAGSGLVSKSFEGNPGAILAATQFGAELGIGFMSSLRLIFVIDNKPSLYAEAMKALVIGRSDCEDFIETPEVDAKSSAVIAYTVKVCRRGRTPSVARFSLDDAQRAGLVGKDNWKKYPQRMLLARARGFACRDAYADVIGGIQTTEEVYDSQEPLESRPVGPPPEGRAKVGSSMREAAQDIAAQTVKKAEELPPHDTNTGEVLEEPPKRHEVPVQSKIKF